MRYENKSNTKPLNKAPTESISSNFVDFDLFSEHGDRRSSVTVLSTETTTM